MCVYLTAFSGAVDIALAILPWKIVWAVAICKREKIGALLAMSMGVLYVQPCSPYLRPLSMTNSCISAGIMAFLKIRTLYTIGNDNTTTVDLFIFGTAEPATAIMAASIPVLRALIKGSDESKPARFIHLSDDGERLVAATGKVEKTEGDVFTAPYPETQPLPRLGEKEEWRLEIGGLDGRFSGGFR